MNLRQDNNLFSANRYGDGYIFELSRPGESIRIFLNQTQLKSLRQSIVASTTKMRREHLALKDSRLIKALRKSLNNVQHKISRLELHEPALVSRLSRLSSACRKLKGE